MSRSLPWPVAILLLYLVVAASTGVSVFTLLWGTGVVAFGLFLTAVVLAVISTLRSGPAPVEWPDAKVGVATVWEVQSVTELKDGRRLVTVGVQVEPADGGVPFNSTFTRRVPQASVAGIQPGLQFPAMYRPQRPEKVKIARGRKQQAAQDFFNHVRVRDGMVQPLELQAAREGVLTEADVVSINPTGQVRGSFPVYDVVLRVRRAGATPYEHRKSMPLSSFEHGLLAATPSVRVKYLPENPQAVAVAIENRQEELT
ncbi:hypothetical protein B842_03595 [Corynebacterium humireducens NBRC 106098 = DSM 45392]|uniref:Uncharacterized protein n=1 Tax=Corynebacterium humireducens NBRC 106098 = DSM 45392 TaxID=1223515 RepID=A0A0B5D615_9CORY|nr:hypothetical protein [Corynebacterium humireducens]AJE32572.1 hypothetical protein B842_03595 [Corynebacterium humireducens NBRC 106098 = DSM 45392]